MIQTLARFIAAEAATEVLGNTTVSLANLANSTRASSATQDPTSVNYGKAQDAMFELLFTPTAGLTAGVTCALFLVPAFDGTNFADGVSVAPAAAHLAFIFTCLNGAGQQRLSSNLPIQLPCVPFKIILENDTGQAFSAATTHQLRWRRFQRAQVI